MSRRAALAAALGVAGLGAALWLLSREVGPFAEPGATVTLADATASTLDTVRVRGRRVEASLAGTVVGIDRSGEVWLSTGDDAVALRFEAPPGLDVEDRLLAVGRLRARGGRRWVDVEAWTVVEARVRAPSAGGV